MIDPRESSGCELAVTIWTALSDWARTLAPWQQYIVGTASGQGRVSDDAIAEAFNRFLREKGLMPSANADEGLPTQIESRPNAPLADKLLLDRVDGLCGINALPEGAALTFGPGLTVIYGRNGAGKSGFARLLANVCFSRTPPKIIADIYADCETPPPPTAQFHVSIGGAEQEPIVFKGEAAVSDLKRITVFDAAVARHHISQASAFEFKPIGFDVFPETVRACNALSEKLDQEIAKRIKPNDFPQSFLGGGTEVHTAVANLGPDSDLEALRLLAKYGEAESARITELDKQILALRSQSPKDVLNALKEAAGDIRKLKDQLVALGAQFNDAALEERAQLISKTKEAVAVAAAAGAEQFKRAFFKAVGTAEWERFATSAHALALKEGEGYPVETDHCLLCERAFDETSRKHVADLLAFVEGDSRKTATEAQKTVAGVAAGLSRLDTNIFSLASRVRAHVHKLAPDLEANLDAAILSLSTTRDTSVSDLQALTTDAGPVNFSDAVVKLDALIERIDKDVERLKADNTEAAIASLELERRTLRHRHVLSQLLPAIETFVADADWVRRASAAKSSLGTRHVTEKEKELFRQIVGDGYLTRLQEECEKLDCTVPIELQTVGRGGQTMRSLAMKGGHKPEAILSEGEQKAVALADFLTEVSLNPASAGIVFDDPVTSQDHQRKERIARRLAAEALSRQVIAFTHDLVFLNQIFVAAEAQGCDIQGHWVDRTVDGCPGQVAFGDTPVTSRTYENTKRAEEALERAKAATGAEREDALRKGMGALRTTLEETVVRKVFKEAVPRWSDQVRVTTLRKINWDNDKIEEICELYEDLSRFIEGHSHTDEATGAPVELADLEARIARVKELRKWARGERQVVL